MDAAHHRAEPVRNTDPVDLLYIAGIGRSGSTLVERLLGEVPGVCSLGEVRHLWERGIVRDERCGCGTAFHACPFWSRVGEAAFGGWHHVDAARVVALGREVDDVSRLPRLLRPGHGDFRDRLREYVGAYEAVYRAAREVTGARVVVDSSKYTSLAYCLRTSAGLDVRLLHAVRDSRGVAYSWTKTVRRPETARGGGDEYMPRFSPARVAVLWSGHNTLVQALRLLRTPVHLARYERFTADPRDFLAGLLEFAGLPVTDGTLAAAGRDWVELGVSHQVAGNPMRYQVGRIPIRADDSWRQALPVRQRRLVTALTAPVALLMGYAPRTLWTTS
jgi:hypothetical protein